MPSREVRSGLRTRAVHRSPARQSGRSCSPRTLAPSPVFHKTASPLCPVTQFASATSHFSRPPFLEQSSGLENRDEVAVVRHSFHRQEVWSEASRDRAKYHPNMRRLHETPLALHS